MRVLALLFAVAHGFNYNLNVYNNSLCTGTVLYTQAASLQNGSLCMPVTFNFTYPGMNATNMTNATMAYTAAARVDFSLFCSFFTSADALTAYASTPNATFNCSTFCGPVLSPAVNGTNDEAVSGCHTYYQYPGVSFQLSNTGGATSCAGLIAFENAVAKLLCISGDTAMQTPSGSVLAMDLEVGTPILTPQGYKPVQTFWHRMPETASCLNVCSKAGKGCVTVSSEHYIRTSQGFETAETLSSAEFNVSPATCDGLVSFYVEGGEFMTKEGGMEVSTFSKTWGLGHNALVWLTEWSGVLALPINDWTWIAETSRCLNRGVFACMFGSFSKLA